MMFLPGLVLLVCVWSPVEPACGPVEEGQPTNLTCNVNTAGCNPSVAVLDWRAQTISHADVILCYTDACGGRYSPNFISATISPTSSTLTINSVSRTVPFNMETKWTCHPCSVISAVTVCDKLQVYSKPSSPSCRMTENLRSGEIMSVTVTCSTDKVYPKAKCSFYTIKNGGQPVQITQTIDYQTPTPTSTTPVYYSSECSVSVPVQELGEGTHRFQGFIYPDVTGGQSLVDGITPDKTVTLSEAKSNLGRKLGSTLTAKFVYPPEVTFTTDPTTTIFNKGDTFKFITDENIKEDSMKTTAIVIGSIALVILATSIIIIAFLVRRIQNLTKKRSERTTDPDLYLVPIDTSDIVNNVQTPENPRLGQYEDVDGVQNTTGSTSISSGLAPVSRQDRDNNDTLPTTHIAMVSASLPQPETNHYETLPDMTPASGPYNSTSPQDVEPPNIYRRPITDTSSTRHGTPSGDYNNIPGQHGETPDSHISSPSAGAAMTSLPNRSYNNVILPSLAGSTRDDIDVKQAYQNVKLK